MSQPDRHSFIKDVLDQQKKEGGKLRPYENPNPISEKEVQLQIVDPFNLTLNLDGKTIGKFWYEDKQLKFKGDVNELTQKWINFVISQFQEFHDEHYR